jgi:hypothetical protein
MNTYKSICALMPLLFFSIFRVSGQSDTVVLTGKNQDFLNTRYKERMSLWYVGGKCRIHSQNGAIPVSTGIFTGFEYKIAPSHAFSLGGGYFWRYALSYYEYSHEYQKVFRVDIAYKWFFDLNHRMKKGLTGNNFSADYLFISPEFVFDYSTYRMAGYAWDFTKGTWSVKYKNDLKIETAWIAGGGFQRTFLNRLNVDVKVGILYRKSYIKKEEFFGEVTLGYIIK